MPFLIKVRRCPVHTLQNTITNLEKAAHSYEHNSDCIHNRIYGFMHAKVRLTQFHYID